MRKTETRRRKKQRTRFGLEDDDEYHSYVPAVLQTSSDDDGFDEANEDLSLRIVEQAQKLQAAKDDPNGFVLDPSGYTGVDVDSSSSCPREVQSSLSRRGVAGEPRSDAKTKKSSKKESRGSERKKKKSSATRDSNDVDAAEEKNGVKVIDLTETGGMEEPDPAQMSDSIVLRKLLRGPRYFDPPNSGWGCCYNCGEEGHLAVNCMSEKQKKPCFVCGGYGHNSKACTKGQECFICNRGGHRARDCPDKHKKGQRSLKMCLKCGDSGHDMFSCCNNYSLDDLKELQCYICKSFGHLCCAKIEDTVLGGVSCYQCGQLGHTGLACPMSHWESPDAGSLSSCYKCGEKGHFARECLQASTSSGRVTIGGDSVSSCYKCGEEGHFARECKRASTRSGWETIGGDSVSSCYKCGEEGHFARECKWASHRNHGQSTPSWRTFKKAKDHTRSRSVHHDLGKSSKRKKIHYEKHITPLRRRIAILGS